jgi:pyruvate dehydrogenase (quinone)
MAGAPKFAESQTLPSVDFAGFAASLGLGSATLIEPEQIASAWDQALRADRPTLLDVHCDPNIPPVPPHATFDQAKAAATAVLKGDEDAFGFIKEGIKVKVQEFIPRGRKSRT